MNFTSDLVDDLATKLLIGLSREENQMVVDEFNIIDETLKKVENIEDALRNCKKTEGREVEVPKVVGGDN